MIEVASSAIAAIGYDVRSCTLLVRFTSGETYGYLDAPVGLLAEFIAAPSKGRFFHEHVDGRFRYERLVA